VSGKGHPVFPDLHLTPEQAQELHDQLADALEAFYTYDPEAAGA